MFSQLYGVLLVAAGLTMGASADADRAFELYQTTDFKAAIEVLNRIPGKNAMEWGLTGQSYFMNTDYKHAAEAFEKAVALEPTNGKYMHWLGRAYGRQAESANPFVAPRMAVKTRQAFEKAAALDPKDKETLNDLFQYYMDAPGFLGGGLDRAEELVEQISRLDAAEGHYAQAQLALKRKDFNSAEQQLHRAMDLAPRQVGRVLDLAKFLARRGRVNESDQAFAQAAKLAPNNPQVLYDRAAVYIKQKRNLNDAAALLEKYLKSSLTPDNAPREKALELLKQAKSD